MISKGYLFAYISVLLSAMYNVIARVSLTFDINPAVFVGIGTMAASVALFQLAGPGRLSFASFKSPRTSLYAICSLLEHLFTIHMFVYVAGAEGSLMQRINMFIAIIIAFAFLNRVPKKKDWIGSILVILGVGTLIYNLNPETRIIAVFWMFMATLFNTIKTFIAELHPESNKAKTFKEQARVTAFVRFLTSFMFLAFLFSTALVKEFSSVTTPILDVAPSLKDFIHPATFVCAIIFGVLNNAPTAYFYFYATKNIKTEKFVAIAAFIPVVTFALEYPFSLFNVVQIRELHFTDLLALALIITGSILISMKTKLVLSKHEEKRLKEAKELVMCAYIHHKHDMKLAIKSLQITKAQFNSIKTSDDFVVSKKLLAKIRKNFNHAVALSDSLTGLQSRVKFISKLNRANKKKHISLIFIDLNKFKPVNDNYGHDAGDEILKQVGDRIEALCPQASVTRLGGDEFCILLEDCKKNDAFEISELIKQELKKNFKVSTTEDLINISASCGIANYPEDTSEPERLITIADELMYEDKKDISR